MSLVLKIALGVVLAFVLLIAGCSALIAAGASEATKEQSWSIKIDAPPNSKWSGHVGDHSIHGSGSHVEEFTDMAITAAVVQKHSAGSWPLVVTLLDEDGNQIDSTSVSAEYGVATVDGSDF